MGKVTSDLDMNKIKDVEASKLSGGEKRRLTIAIALLGNPEVTKLAWFPFEISALNVLYFCFYLVELSPELLRLYLQCVFCFCGGFYCLLLCSQSGAVLPQKKKSIIKVTYVKSDLCKYTLMSAVCHNPPGNPGGNQSSDMMGPPDDGG